ncbi:hypothetical protein C8J55DRAFT_496202, partial [Lentinula edodes]
MLLIDVGENLGKHCHYVLYFIPPVSEEYWSMAVMSDSHSIAYSKLIAHEEEEVIQILKDRMYVCKNQGPQTAMVFPP